MMYNGWKPDEIDNLSCADFNKVVEAHTKGLVGPYKDYIIGYNIIGQINNLNNQNIKLANKKNKINKLPSFHEIFPNLQEVNTGRTQEEEKKQNMALKSAIQLQMPAHIWRKLHGNT